MNRRTVWSLALAVLVTAFMAVDASARTIVPTPNLSGTWRSISATATATSVRASTMGVPRHGRGQQPGAPASDPDHSRTQPASRDEPPG
jgi:hypothetical protein